MTPLESLCRSCGLCCDGTLFSKVPLNFSEVVPEAKLKVITNGFGARSIPQRCAALEGTLCQVYSERPVVCRRYECSLLVALRDNEVGIDEAMATIDRARTLASQAAQDASVRGERDAFLSFYFGRRT